jgi:mevalonate kinase
VEAQATVTASPTALSLDPTDPIDVAVAVSLDFLDIAEPRIRYEVTSSVPEQRGMGSSAAVAIAVIRAVFDYYDQPLPHRVLEDLTNQAEKIAHGNPSGLDAKTCLSDHFIRYSKEEGFQPLTADLGGHLIIADTGIYGNTSQAVGLVRSQGDQAQPHLKRLGELAQAFIDRLEVANLADLGQLMTQAHHELKILGVSCDQSDQLVSQALAAGAYGAKMSGGGLGGCIIALTDTYKTAQAIAQILREKGAVNTWIENL